MARNRKFDDVLDELKMLHDAKNHDYATADNPYKNLEGVKRIGIEPWRGIVIRLMDKFERLEGFCRTRELAVKNESIEDTFKDIAIYSTLAMILYRKGQVDDEYSRKILSEKGLRSGSLFTPVDDKLQCDMDSDHPIIAMRRAAEAQQEEEKLERLKREANNN